jgi:hypothetical protein
MLYLLPASAADCLDLPDGTRYRVLSTRQDLFRDSQGQGSHVLQSDSLLDFEPVLPEDFDKLGSQEDLDKCIESFIKHKAIDKDAEFSSQVSALAERIYGVGSEKTLTMKQAVDEVLAKPIDIGLAGRLG